MQENIELNMTEVEEELDIFEFLHFVLRRIRYIVLGMLAGLLLAGFFAFIIATPIYEATSQLYVVSSKDSVVNLSDLQIGSYLTSDYQLVFDTWEVNEMVISKLNLPYTVEQLRRMVTVTNPNNTRALMITVRSKNREEVAVIANEFADVATEYISKTMQTEMPTLLSEALEPIQPVSPRKARILAIGAVAGILIALWILFIRFVGDDKVKTSEDILECTGSLPLSVIPITNRDYSDRAKRW